MCDWVANHKTLSRKQRQGVRHLYKQYCSSCQVRILFLFSILGRRNTLIVKIFHGGFNLVYLKMKGAGGNSLMLYHWVRGTILGGCMCIWFPVHITCTHRFLSSQVSFWNVQYFDPVFKTRLPMEWVLHTSNPTRFCILFFRIDCSLITCVIARSNPRRLLPIWREKLHGHYHITMTSDNDFCVWRWHYRERHSRVSVNAQTIPRNAPRIRALITSRNDRHVWTDRNSFTGMSTEMIKNAVFFVFLSKKYT